ncbi:MAG: efflux RND transporter permease subunit [Pseudomonadota bacterium]
MNFAAAAIKYRLISWIVVLGSLVGGTIAYNTMPRFEDPEFTIRIAQIVTMYPGATPLEVANEVSDVIESELQEMQEVDEITSYNYWGMSIVQVEIKYAFSTTKTDLQSAFTRMRNKIRDASSELPAGATTPLVNDEYGDVYGIYYAITGDGFTIKELYDYAEDLRTDILTVDNVAKVDFRGNQDERIYLEISRERAAAFGVSLQDVFNDLAEQNSVVSAGDAAVGSLRIEIYPTGEITTVEQIGGTVVTGGASGDVIYLRDIADIRRGYVDPATYLTRFNGEAAIAIAVSNVSGSNVAQMGDDIRAKIDDVIGKRPIGIEVNEFYHQGDAVNESVSSFASNVIAAVVIVLVTLFIFMGARSAIIIGATLVITIAATLLTMYMIGIPMHRISLGALIIALGMLVDNSIVVTEGILVGVQRGRKKLDIAMEIVDKTKWALMGGTAVGIIAFAPIGLAPGNTGEYCRHLFYVILISLSYSFIFAVTIVPLLGDLIFKEPENPEEEGKDGTFTRLYKGFMRAILVSRYVVILLTIGMFAVAIYGFGFVKGGFFPSATTPQLSVEYWLPEGTDIEVTNADMAIIEEAVRGFEGVSYVHSMIGAGTMRYMLIYSPENPNNAFGELIVRTENLEVIPDLITRIQAYLDEEFPAAQARVSRYTLGPSSGAKIQAAFSGPDPAELRRISNEALGIMLREPRATGVKTDWRDEVPVLESAYNPERGNRVGVSRETLAETLATNFSGTTIGTYREGDDLIPIVFRAPDEERLRAEIASSIQVPSSRTGDTVPITEVVDGVRFIWEDSQLIRENRVWMITVEADPIPGVIASDLLGLLRPKIEALELPEGYALEWKGEIGDSAEANAQLAGTIPLGILAMIFVVVLLFNAVRQPAVIWFLVPLSIIGVVMGLLITDTTLEFMAILGILSLSGLLIKNAIVLVDEIDLQIGDGVPRYDAVLSGSASRVRPVMMGALTTVLGVIPLMGDIFFRSMAVVIIFGLSFATILTLIVLPALYATVFGIQSSERAEA